MKKMLRMMILLLATGAVANATAYYVAKTGSDSANGSISTPWLTISHAASMAVAGDTVTVEDGTYVETVNLKNGGSSGNPVTFQSQNKWGAQIVPTAAQITALSDIIVNIGAAYVTFQNFAINGVNESNADAAAAGIKCQSTANNCIVSGNEIYAIGVNATQCPSGGAILIAGNNNSLLGNYIYNVSPLRTAGFRCNHEHGVYVTGGNDGFAQNNIIFEIWQGIGFQFDSGSPSGWTVTNNTIFNVGSDATNSGAGIYANCDTGTCSNNNISNNLIQTTKSTGDPGCIWQVNTGTWDATNTWANNLEYACNGSITVANNSLTGTVTSNALFVNYTGDQTGDYHLQASSPAINAGTATGAPATDYDGVIRHNPPSIGAYEFVVASAPSPPTGLTATVY